MDRNLIYIILGTSIIGIFTMWLEALIQETSFRIIAALCGLEFVAAIVWHLTEHGPSAAAAMLAPLPTLIYFRLCRMVFVRVVRREPINVAHNWTPGLAKDRIFAFVFMAGAVSMLLAAIQLAQLGW